ncbi:MAG: Hsp20/alpha crystallin family protein [Lagierella massiliensis]|nr:Hsp20/alpha crystallin family protein [Lagierella massiliensis]
MFKKISPRITNPLQGQFKDLYGMMDDFFSENINLSASTNFKVNVLESKDSYLIEAELPGFKKEDIKVSLNDGQLNIKAEKKEENSETNEKKNYIHREIRYSQMSRTLYFENITRDNLKAKLDDGILSITINKLDPKKDQDYVDIE